MNTPFLRLPAEQQIRILQQASSSLKIHVKHLEKDYWVCQVLSILFSISGMKEHLCFRGGTSLSKAFKCITRFSEDIDVALSPRYFADMPESLYTLGEDDSTAQRDRKQRKQREYYRRAMSEDILPALQRGFAERGIEGVEYQLYNLDKARDPFVLYVVYPTLFPASADDYVLPNVKLELSGRAQTTPSTPATIDYDIARVFPEMSEPVELEVVSPRRTLWEKAFILHEENLRGGPNRERLSRHYYDIDALMRSGAYDPALFEQVKRLRAITYGYTWVDYDNLGIKDMLLVPPDETCYLKWKSDYERMSTMIYGNVDDFSTIISRIRAFLDEH